MEPAVNDLVIVNDLENNKCQCGHESEVGAHQVSNGVVVSFYKCLSCYNKEKKSV